MTQDPLISVLLVNYNGLSHLEECLSSVLSQDFAAHEIVLVDNASRDGSVEYLRIHFPAVKIIEADTNLGFAGGNNLGLKHCTGEHVFFLNNDTRMESGTLRAIADGIRSYPDCRVFACFMLKYSDPSRVDNAGEVLYKSGHIQGFAGYPAGLFTNVREVIGACAGAAVYARSLLNEIGGFDEDFFLLFEDLDLSLRARHNGEQILFLPKARILHKGSASIGGHLGPTAVYFGARNFFPLLVKNFPWPTAFKLMPGFVMAFAVRGWQVIEQGLFVVYLRGLRDGLRALPRALRQRRVLFSRSRIGRREFERLLRSGWFRERLAFRRGDYRGIP